jgi:hypothetical protein
MSGLCKYKDIAGKPGEGGHAWRIGGAHGTRQGIAGVDLLLTAGAAFLISRVSFKRLPRFASFLVVFIVLIISAVAAHRAFCVETSLNRWLGFDDKIKKTRLSAGFP